MGERPNRCASHTTFALPSAAEACPSAFCKHHFASIFSHDVAPKSAAVTPADGVQAAIFFPDGAVRCEISRNVPQ
jgi:hypothetical protein